MRSLRYLLFRKVITEDDIKDLTERVREEDEVLEINTALKQRLVIPWIIRDKSLPDFYGVGYTIKVRIGKKQFTLGEYTGLSNGKINLENLENPLNIEYKELLVLAAKKLQSPYCKWKLDGQSVDRVRRDIQNYYQIHAEPKL